MQLSHCEVVEAEAEFGRHIRIGVLFPWKRDVQSNGLGSDIVRASVRGFHDSGTAPGHDHDTATYRLFAGSADDLPESTCHLVVPAFFNDGLCDIETAPQGLITRVCKERFGCRVHRSPGSLRFANARAAEDDDGMGDLSLLEHAFRFEKIEL
jgi:hypothetical protein